MLTTIREIKLFIFQPIKKSYLVSSWKAIFEGTAFQFIENFYVIHLITLFLFHSFGVILIYICGSCYRDAFLKVALLFKIPLFLKKILVIYLIFLNQCCSDNKWRIESYQSVKFHFNIYIIRILGKGRWKWKKLNRSIFFSWKNYTFRSLSNYKFYDSIDNYIYYVA